VSIRESEYDVLGGTLIGIGPLVSDWELSSASWIRQLLSRIVARRPTVICSLSLSLSLSECVCVRFLRMQSSSRCSADRRPPVQHFSEVMTSSRDRAGVAKVVAGLNIPLDGRTKNPVAIHDVLSFPDLSPIRKTRGAACGYRRS
jgi:hypothetical protein